MKNKTKKAKLISIILIFFTTIFFNNYFNISQASSSEYPEVKPGDVIWLPDYRQYPQYGGNIECDLDGYKEDGTRRKWYYSCKKMYDAWAGFGKPTNELSLCYIPVAGIDWIFVAVSPTFGEGGDYLKVHIKEEKTGKEKDYYMIIFDHKGHDQMYILNGVHWGHNQAGKIDILEFPWHGPRKITREFLQSMKNVIYIQNGGNYFEHPNGPVGFSAVSTMEYEKDAESGTFAGSVKLALRNIWNAVTTFIDNHFQDENKSTVLYDLYSESNLVWPVPGHTRISSGFGPRKSPTAGASSNHMGIDIPAKEGVPEVAAGTGIVKEAGYFSKGSGYQCYLYLDDETSFGGEVIFGYLHSSPTPVVKPGDHVTAGQQITTVGPMWVTVPEYGTVTNGVMTGTHLHFSMRIDGEHVDPELYFPEEMRE